MQWRIQRMTWLLLMASSVLEIAYIGGFMGPMLTIGFVELPWALVTVIAVMVSLLKPRKPTTKVGWFAALSLVGLVLSSGVIYAQGAGRDLAVFIIATAVTEEAIFRLALPGLLAVVLMRTGMQQQHALGVSLAIAACLFAAMPGHIAQMQHLGTLAVFLSFAALMSYAVWKGVSLWPAIAAHAAVDFFTLAASATFISTELRTLGVLASLTAMCLLVITTTNRNAAVIAAEQVLDLRDAAPLEKVA